MTIEMDLLKSLKDKLIIRVEHPEEEGCYADVKPDKIESIDGNIVITITSPV